MFDQCHAAMVFVFVNCVFPRKHAFVDISVFLWLCKQRPRFAQGQPKGYFQLKELYRTTKAYSQMNAD